LTSLQDTTAVVAGLLPLFFPYKLLNYFQLTKIDI